MLPRIPYLEAWGWKCEHAREGKTGDERRSEEGNWCKKVYNYKCDSIYTTDILNVLKSWGEGGPGLAGRIISLKSVILISLDDWKSFKNKPMSM